MKEFRIETHIIFIENRRETGEQEEKKGDKKKNKGIVEREEGVMYCNGCKDC